MSEKNDIDSMQHAWQRWWDYEGSAMRPHPSEDTEQFAGRITNIAWSNGAYKRLAEIERLRAELAAANARIAELEAMQPQPTLSRSLQLEQALAAMRKGEQDGK